MDNNQAPFRVGQKVVCIDDSSRLPPDKAEPFSKYIKKGNVFTVLNTEDGCCRSQLIDIGLTTVNGNTVCSICATVYKSKIRWVLSNRFAPIHELPADIREELCKQIYIGDTADAPVKEIVNN